MIDKLLFKSRHWVIFSSFIVLIVIAQVAELALEIPANVIVAPVYVVWLPLLGVRLKRFLPPHYAVHYRMFLAAWAILFMAVIYSYFVSERQEGTLFIILWLVIGYTFFFTMLGFIARAIKCLQTHDRATVSDYFGDVFLLLAFPVLGVWIIQPRLNLLYDQFLRD